MMFDVHEVDLDSHVVNNEDPAWVFMGSVEAIENG